MKTVSYKVVIGITDEKALCSVYRYTKGQHSVLEEFEDENDSTFLTEEIARIIAEDLNKL